MHLIAVAILSLLIAPFAWQQDHWITGVGFIFCGVLSLVVVALSGRAGRGF